MGSRDIACNHGYEWHCRYIPEEPPEEGDVDERSEDGEVEEGGDVHAAAQT